MVKLLSNLFLTHSPYNLRYMDKKAIIDSGLNLVDTNLGLIIDSLIYEIEKI